MNSSSIKYKNTYTKNIFSYFLEKALTIWEIVSFVVPKSLISSPEYLKTRELIENYNIENISDYWEHWFKWVKIETISIQVSKKGNVIWKTNIYSHILKTSKILDQGYITDNKFPYWLIYRDTFFDEIAKSLQFNIFKAFRDRQITKKNTLPIWKYWVLKSRNLNSKWEIVSLKWYDSFIDSITWINVVNLLSQDKKFIIVPNLTYSPRATFLPKGYLVDWSLAILYPREDIEIKKEDLEYYATDEYKQFYKIARNYWTRSLNIDSNSVFFFWIKKTSLIKAKLDNLYKTIVTYNNNKTWFQMAHSTH